MARAIWRVASLRRWALRKARVADSAGDGTIQVVAIAGHSRTLLDALKRKFATDSRVAPVGFTSEMPDLMAACDAILTKPKP